LPKADGPSNQLRLYIDNHPALEFKSTVATGSRQFALFGIATAQAADVDKGSPLSIDIMKVEEGLGCLRDRNGTRDLRASVCRALE
jgi:hypothetical protein